MTHINNEEDPIPIVPGKFLGFHHPSGEVHITGLGTWESCPGEFSLSSLSLACECGFFGGALAHVQRVALFSGQDNTSTLCIVGNVPNIFDGILNDHDGPYNGIVMGC